MATANPFHLLGNDDNDDPSQLIAAAMAHQPPPPAKKVSAQAVQPPAKQGKLPSKPLPPAQSVREARNDVGRGGARGGGGRGFSRGGGYNREPMNNDNGFSGGYKPSRDGDARKDTESRGYGGSRPSFQGARRGGFRNGEGIEGGHPKREYDRHSGTGHGSDIKREGAGRNNWGTHTDGFVPENEEPVVNENEKTVSVEKEVVEAVEVETETGDATKEAPVIETQEKEPEPEEMTLEEYQKVLEEKRKALLSLKSEERKADLDKDLKSMQPLSSKKTNDEIFAKLGLEKSKGKEVADKEEKAKKSLSISDFLKPAEGERHNNPGGRGRGRGRGGARGGGYGGSNTNDVRAPSIEDPSVFPSLGGK